MTGHPAQDRFNPGLHKVALALIIQLVEDIQHHGPGIDLAQHRDYLAKWLEAGYHGEMEWMASHGQKRTHPDALVPGTCTVITARMDYLPAGESPEPAAAMAQAALTDLENTLTALIDAVGGLP